MNINRVCRKCRLFLCSFSIISFYSTILDTSHLSKNFAFFILFLRVQKYLKPTWNEFQSLDVIGIKQLVYALFRFISILTADWNRVSQINPELQLDLFLRSGLHPKWQENAWRLLSKDASHIRNMGEFDNCYCTFRVLN